MTTSTCLSTWLRSPQPTLNLSKDLTSYKCHLVLTESNINTIVLSNIYLLLI